MCEGISEYARGFLLAPSDWRDRSAIDVSEGHVALVSAMEARVRGNEGLED